MSATSSGSFRLFRVAGIDVFLHWTWFLVAAYIVMQRLGAYSSPLWNVAEYLALFAIVLLHEFGHSLASRQVGGESREILLWPFGGIAFVKVPQRPGAELWSIAAGPMVNVALWPLLMLVAGAVGTSSDFGKFLYTVWLINKGLLIFNLLPIYPLDGGQILRSLLWFVTGRTRSLQIATILGFVGIAWLAWRAIQRQSMFSGMIALFLAQQCWASFQRAKAMAALAKLPRHPGFACPACKETPPGGPLWLCHNCRNGFDPFSTRAICPHCQTPQPSTACPHCGASHPMAEWPTPAQPP